MRLKVALQVTTVSPDRSSATLMPELTPIGGNGGEYSQNGHGRPSMSRPDSFVDYGASGSNGYNNGQHSHNQYGAPSRGNRPRYGNSRMNSEYANGGGYSQQQQPQQPQQQPQQPQNLYPNSPYQRSNDNVTAGSGSANTDQWGNSTDPSSVNSSFDRLQQQAQMKQQQDGGPAPPPHRQSYSQMNGANGHAAYNNAYNGGGVASMSSQPFNPPLPGPPKKASDDDDKKKRGSWFKRRFSKD